jgi:hypothetical protein
MSIFEKAVRQKLRFPSSKGPLTVEQLFDLSLESLNSVALAVDATRESSAKSFIAEASAANTTADLQLEILVYVIKTKKDEALAKSKRREKLAALERLRELQGQKQDEALRSKSEADLAAMIAEIEKDL